MKQEEDKITAIITNKGKESAFGIKKEMQEIMMDYVGIFRNAADLEIAVEKLKALRVFAHKLFANCVCTEN